MGRTEYYDDPNAPTPNSVVIAASAAVFDDGRVLMQRRADSGLWALPGGGMEMGESLPAAAVREVREETGYDIEVVGLVGTYSDPRHVIAYDDGEVRRQFNICFRGALLGGSLAVSSESTDVRWVAVEDLSGLPMHDTQALRVRHAAQGGTPHFG